MPRWKVPSENIVYADRAGNIGEHSVGLAPIRSWTGLLPVPGAGNYQWSGFLPVSKLPHSFNPAAGFTATANQKMIPEHYPYNVGFRMGAAVSLRAHPVCDRRRSPGAPQTDHRRHGGAAELTSSPCLPGNSKLWFARPACGTIPHSRISPLGRESSRESPQRPSMRSGSSGSASLSEVDFLKNTPIVTRIWRPTRPPCFQSRTRISSDRIPGRSRHALADAVRCGTPGTRTGSGARPLTLVVGQAHTRSASATLSTSSPAKPRHSISGRYPDRAMSTR